MIHFDPFELDLDAADLRRGAERITLQAQPLQLLTTMPVRRSATTPRRRASSRPCHAAETPFQLGQLDDSRLDVISRASSAACAHDPRLASEGYEPHVWAWRENPRGTSADFNPRVSYDGFTQDPQ